jgi:hypothetical protein
VFSFDFPPHVLMPSTTGIGGSGQKVSERGLYPRVLLTPPRARSTGDRAAASILGQHFLAHFFFAVKKEVGRRKGETMT